MLIFQQNNERITPVQTNQTHAKPQIYPAAKITQLKFLPKFPLDQSALRSQFPSMEISKTGRSHSVLFQTPTYSLTTKANLHQQCRKSLQAIREGVSMQSLIPHRDSLLLFANSGCKKAHFPPSPLPLPALPGLCLHGWALGLGGRQGSLSTVHLPVPPRLLQARLPPSPGLNC